MPIRLAYPLDQSVFYRLRSRSKLARLLNVSLAELKRFVNSDANYSEFNVGKKTGGYRQVENPKRSLKLAQATMARQLSRIAAPDFLYCPVKGRCYITNAAAHRDNRVIHSLDIKKFFPSVPQSRVYYFFAKIMKCESDIASLLADIACYKGHLPTGSPLSPILAYFSYYELWQQISVFCQRNGYTLSIYIDDVTISGSKVPRKDIWQVKQMIYSQGLRYHKEKTFVDVPAEVTGVIIKQGRLVAPFRSHLKLREARLNLAHCTDEEAHAFKGRVTGINGQIRQIAAKDRH